MADEYKGLYIVFNGDATRLTRALKQVEQASRSAQTSLKKVKDALKLDSKSPQLLAAGLNAAATAARKAQDKVTALKDAEQQLASEGKLSAEAQQRLARETAIAEAELKKARQELVRFSEANTPLGQSVAKWTEFGTKVQSASEKLEGASKAVSGLGDSIIKSVTVPLSVAGGSVVKVATDIDTAWRGVVKTVDGTAEELVGLKDVAIEMSTVQPVPAETILNVMELGGQLGVSTDKLEDFSRVVSGLDIATNLGADEAATTMAQLNNIMKFGEENFERFGSAIVDLGNHSATTETDILNMASRIGSAGTLAGFSTQEILGISTALASTGMNAEAGGSAISKSMGLISKAVATGSLSFEDYAKSVNRSDKVAERAWTTQKQHLETFAEVNKMTVEEFQQAWEQDASGTFLKTIDNLSAMGEASDDMIVKLDAMGLGEIRTSDAFRRLAGNVGNLTGFVDRANTAWDQNTALQTEVDKRNESLQGRFDVLKNKVIAFAESIGGPLAEALLNVLEPMGGMLDDADDLAEGLGRFSQSVLEGFVGTLSKVGDFLKMVADGFASLSPFAQNLIGNIVGIVAASGPLISVVGRIGSGVSSLIGTFGKMVNGVQAVRGVWNTFQVSMKAADGQLIKGYQDMDRQASAAEKLAGKLGLAANANTVAAGGADRYAEAQIRLTSAQDRAKAVAENLQKGIKDIAVAEKEAAAAAAYQEAAEQSKADAIKQRGDAYQNLADTMRSSSSSIREAEQATAQAREQSATRLKAADDAIAAARESSAARIRATEESIADAQQLSRDASEKLAQTQADYNKRLEEGMVTKAQYNKAIGDAAREAKNASKAVEQAEKEQARAVRDGAKEVEAAKRARIRTEQDCAKQVKAAEDAQAKAASKAVSDIERSKARIGKANDSVATSEKRLQAAMDNSAAKTGRVNSEVKKQETRMRALRGAMNEANAAQKAMGNGMATVGQRVKSLASTLGNTLMPALKMVGVSAAIGLVTVAVTSMVEAYQEAKRKAEDYRRATEGLREVSERGTSGFNAMGEAAKDTAKSVSDLVEETEAGITATAELADELSAMYQQAGSEKSRLDEAWAAIEQYANKTGLAADEQAAFRAAIETVNDVCGTQYKVIDSSRGMFADEAGVIQNNTDKIRENIDARKAQIEADVQMEAAKKIYEDYYDSRTRYAEQEEKLAEKQKEYNELIGKRNKAYEEGNTALAGKYIYQVEELKEEIDELTDSMGKEKAKRDELYESYQRAMGAYGQAAQAAELGIQSAEDWAKACEAVGKGLQDSGLDAEFFAKKMDEAGVSSDAMAALSEENIQKVAEAFASNGGDIVEALKSIGPDGEKVLSGAVSQWANSLNDKGMVAAAAELTGSTILQFKGFATALGIEGDQAIVAFATALASGKPRDEAIKIGQQVQEALGDADFAGMGTEAINAYALALSQGKPEDEAREIAKAVAMQLGNPEAAKEAGLDGIANEYLNMLDQLLGQAKEKGALVTKAYAESIVIGSETDIPGAVQTMKDMTVAGMDASGVAEQARALGLEVPQGVADTINENASTPEEAARSMQALVLAALQNGDWSTVTEQMGEALPQGLAEGINNSTGEAEDGAGNLATFVVNAVKAALGIHSPSTVFAEIGQNIVAGLAEGIGDGSSASGALQNLVSVLVGIFNPVPQRMHEKGVEAGTGFGTGIGSAVESASTGAAALAQAAQGGVSLVPENMSETGRLGSSGFATGISSSIGTTSTNAKSLRDAVNSSLRVVPGESKGFGNDSSKGFATGLGANLRSAQVAGGDLKAAAYLMNAYSGQSYNWGSHLGQNFASGLRNAISVVSSAASAVASAAKGILGFSVPDEGPWSGAEKGGETSGRHLVENFARGMMSGIPDVKAASMALATASTPPSYRTSWAVQGSYRLAESGQSKADVAPVVNNNFNAKVVRSDADLDAACQIMFRAGMSASREVF